MGKIVRNGVTYGGSSTSAENVAYDNTDSGLEAVVVQDAIDELKANDVGRFEKDNQGDILGEIFNTYTGNNKNVANGEYSHAEGFHTTASSFSSHAEGDHTTASGYASHAGGYETIATANYQTVIGKYNIADIVGAGDSDSSDSDSSDSDSDSDTPIPSSSQHLFIIGNGIDVNHRSNIVEVTEDTFNVNGDITVAGKPLVVQCETMSTADEYLLGRIVQYVGATDANYTHGCFYECVGDGEEPPTYSWQITNVIKFDTTPTSGSANAVTSDGIYSLIHKGVGVNSAVILPTSTASGQYSVAIGHGLVSNQNYQVNVGRFNSSKQGDIFEIGNGSSNTNRSNIVEVTNTEFNVNGDIKKNNVSLPTPYTTMPTITAAMLGQIAMYVGETTNDYVKGYFYIASSDGAAEPTYSWVSMVDNTPTRGSKNLISSNAVYQKTPWERGSYENTAHIGRYSAATNYNTVAMGYYASASGDGAIAAGSFARSNQPGMFSCGKCNSPRSGDIFNVGNGTSNNSRSNIIEANETSMNVNGDIQRDGVGIDDYTTTERKIGKWIDGSDLYQRTFEVTGLVNGQWNSSVLGTSGINIVDIQGWIDWTYNGEPNCRTDLNYYANSSDYVSMQNAYNDIEIKPNRTDAGVQITESVITIKYTKPSVQANVQQNETRNEPIIEEEPVEEPVTEEESIEEEQR